MKRTILPIIAAGLLLASCDTDTKDTTSVMPIGEYNLIVSGNPENPATASSCVYKLAFNLTKGSVAVSTDKLIFNNADHSFETDTMSYAAGLFKDFESRYFEMGRFSSVSDVGKGASITNLTATFTSGSYYVTDNVPGFYTPTGVGMRLVMGYDYNDTYHVQTFWPECFYKGDTMVTSVGSYNGTTSEMTYRIVMDMEKMTAQCVVYSPIFGTNETPAVTAIVMSEIPVKFTHSSYYLEASAPKTQILKLGASALAESDSWKAEDFRLSTTSSDLTHSMITFKIAGHDIRFTGSSVADPTL